MSDNLFQTIVVSVCAGCLTLVLCTLIVALDGNTRARAQQRAEMIETIAAEADGGVLIIGNPSTP